MHILFYLFIMCILLYIIFLVLSMPSPEIAVPEKFCLGQALGLFLKIKALPF